MKKNKGFTLIELLVVIAIIAILAAVVTMFFNSAKRKGADTSIKSGMNQTRIQADIYYNYSGTYVGLCDVASDNANPKGINAMILNSGKATGYASAVNIRGTGGTYEVRCNDAATGWAAQVPLSDGTSYYCVDYTRKGIVTSTSIGNNTGFCQ